MVLPRSAPPPDERAYGPRDRAARSAPDPTAVHMSDGSFDSEVYDTEEIDEIRMLTDLMIAASESVGPLPRDVVDQILGVR